MSGEYLKMAAGTLSAHAEFSGETRELHTRAAWHAGALYYELRPGKVARIGPGGWTFEAQPPVLFRRYANLKPLPDPESGGTLDVLDELVNLKGERDQRLFKAYLATLPLEHVGRPIFNASGAMGSGKTTIGRVAKRTWDPTAPETVRFDPRDFLQKAAHAYVVMLDNQNTIPEWASDTLCRLVTGEADSKRRLYTDDEDVIIELRRAVILNGINVPTDRGDVLDRSLVVELERIPDAERKTEEELWERFEREHSQLLGALFDVLSKAIALKPSLQLSRRPRLADWGEYAAAVYEALGWGAETFLKDWDEVVKVQNQATLDGSPVAQCVLKFMEDKTEHTAGASELHKELSEVAEDLGVERDKAWPKSARWLWKRLKEILPVLSAAGIEARRERPDKGTVIALRKALTSNASNASEGENAAHKGKRLAIRTALMPVLMPETSLMPALMPALMPLKQRVLATLTLLAIDPGVLGRTIQCASTGNERGRGHHEHRGRRVDLAREPGRALNRDISRSMAVDAENDAFIERRHNQRVQEEGKRLEEAVFMETTRQEEARRREQNRGGWLDYYRRLEAGYLERAAECGQRANELERTA